MERSMKDADTARAELETVLADLAKVRIDVETQRHVLHRQHLEYKTLHRKHSDLQTEAQRSIERASCADRELEILHSDREAQQTERERLQGQIRELTHDCLCPIKKTLLRNPVVAADGHSYNPKAINRWLQEHGTSPMTNLPLSSRSLVPNHLAAKFADCLRGEIQNSTDNDSDSDQQQEGSELQSELQVSETSSNWSDPGEEDADDLDPISIDLVMRQFHLRHISRRAAISALHRNNNDVVEAIMDLASADPRPSSRAVADALEVLQDGGSESGSETAF